jgi:hypothetical protein
LRSPFNGEVWTVPPDSATPAFIEALLARGFERVDEPAKEKKKHG